MGASGPDALPLVAEQFRVLARQWREPRGPDLLFSRLCGCCDWFKRCLASFSCESRH